MFNDFLITVLKIFCKRVSNCGLGIISSYSQNIFLISAITILLVEAILRAFHNVTIHKYYLQLLIELTTLLYHIFNDLSTVFNKKTM